LPEIDTALESLDRAEIKRQFDGRGMDSIGVSQDGGRSAAT